MSRDYSSISRFGLTEPFELQVARGQIAYHESVFKFGFNPDVDDSLETVWSQGGLYSYLTSASVLKVSSSSLPYCNSIVSLSSSGSKCSYRN